MGIKRNLVEAIVSAVAKRRSTQNDWPPPRIDKIFVLRNNSIGDLLVITPLFEALKRHLPEVKIVAGIGAWNFPVLKNNPYITEILEVNAPWHNINSCRAPHNSIRGLTYSLKYILSSNEAEEIKRKRFDVGIDILGSPEGSILMLKAEIPYRLGVKGYAGGHSAVQRFVQFNANEHVGRSALRFAEFLGATNLPEVRPEIFLSLAENEEAEYLWNQLRPKGGESIRLVIGPGGGFPQKCWPIESYEELVRKLTTERRLQIAVVGGPQDKAICERLAAISPSVKAFAGKLDLRQTFALVARSKLVLCNSSMLMHAAAAFSKPAVVLLPETYASAEAHSRQWGYDTTTIVVGKDIGRNFIYSVEDVFEAIRPSIL